MNGVTFSAYKHMNRYEIALKKDPYEISYFDWSELVTRDFDPVGKAEKVIRLTEEEAEHRIKDVVFKGAPLALCPGIYKEFRPDLYCILIKWRYLNKEFSTVVPDQYFHQLTSITENIERIPLMPP